MNFQALIIDDDNSSRKIAKYFLEKMGFNITEAQNGELGILNLMNEGQDIVILDWKMPNLNGSDTMILFDAVLKQARFETKSLFKLPITTIIYSSVNLYELEFPATTYFKIKGYVDKNWSVEQQNRQFKKIVKNLEKYGVVA